MDVALDYFTKKHWDQVSAARGTTSSDVGTALVDSLVSLVAEYRPTAVLDVGCGNGLLACRIAEAVADAEVVGIDYSDEAIRLATEQLAPATAPEVRGRLSFAVGTADQLPYADSTFDAITMLKTAWALPDLGAALAELTRVLRPSGRLFVQTWADVRDCVPLLLSNEVLGGAINGLTLPDWAIGPFYLTPERIREYLKAAGLPAHDQHRHDYDVIVGNAEEFWDRLRTIAGSAYWSLTVQPEVDRAALDADWRRRSERYRQADGRIRLPIAWYLTVAGAA